MDGLQKQNVELREEMGQRVKTLEQQVTELKEALQETQTKLVSSASNARASSTHLALKNKAVC